MHLGSYFAKRDRVLCQNCVRYPLKPQSNTVIYGDTLIHIVAEIVDGATPQHIAIELFKVMADVNVTLVPYAGSTPALEAVLAGQADAMFDSATRRMRVLRLPTARWR